MKCVRKMGYSAPRAESGKRGTVLFLTELWIIDADRVLARIKSLIKYVCDRISAIKKQPGSTRLFFRFIDGL